MKFGFEQFAKLTRVLGIALLLMLGLKLIQTFRENSLGLIKDDKERPVTLTAYEAVSYGIARRLDDFSFWNMSVVFVTSLLTCRVLRRPIFPFVDISDTAFRWSKSKLIAFGTIALSYTALYLALTFKDRGPTEGGLFCTSADVAIRSLQFVEGLINIVFAVSAAFLLTLAATMLAYYARKSMATEEFEQGKPSAESLFNAVVMVPAIGLVCYFIVSGWVCGIELRKDFTLCSQPMPLALAIPAIVIWFCPFFGIGAWFALHGLEPPFSMKPFEWPNVFSGFVVDRSDRPTRAMESSKEKGKATRRSRRPGNT